MFIIRAVESSQTLDWQSPLRVFIIFITQGCRGRCNPTKWGWGKAPGALQILIITAPGLLEIKLLTKLIYSCLKIDRITSRKIKYQKDFFQQNRSLSAFIRNKKGTLMWLKVIGGRCPLCLPSSDILMVMYSINAERSL